MKEQDVALPIREIPRKSTISQAQRIIWLQPWVQQGLIKLPVGMVKPLETEMMDFRMDPKRSGHDDALSSLTDAVQMSRATVFVEPKKKPVYNREYMDRVRERLFSVEDEIEKTLQVTERHLERSGYPILSYART